MILNYNCKFCGKPGRVDAGENTHGIFDLTKWVKILCCDPCGKYMVDKRKIQDAIKAQCLDLWAIRKQEKDVEKVSKAEVKAEENLIALTKRYAHMICEHNRRETLWDAEFVNSLMDRPRQCENILRIYRLGIAKA